MEYGADWLPLLPIVFRFVERIAAIALGAAILLWAFRQFAKAIARRAPAPNDEGTVRLKLAGTEIDVKVGRFGAGVALTVIGLVLPIAIFNAPLEINGQDGSVRYYGEVAVAGSLMPVMSETTLDDLKRGIDAVLRQDPDSDAVARLKRAYERIYDAGALTPDLAERRAVLLGKRDELTDTERNELQWLSNRYSDEYAPSWR